jgi:hypothetical protein
VRFGSVREAPGGCQHVLEVLESDTRVHDP